MTEKPENTSQKTPETSAPKMGFRSLRWRFVTPVFVVVLIVAMAGAYLVAQRFSSGVEVSQVNTLLQGSRAVNERAVGLYERQRQEAQRIAFTVGVAEAILAQDGQSLHDSLEGLARVAELDSVIVTDARGVEVLGLQRVENAGDYALSTSTDLGEQPIIRGVIEDGYIGATQLLRTNEGIVLYTAVPVTLNGQTTGIALVGQRLSAVLADMRGGSLADITFYGEGGIPLQTTLDVAETLDDLTLPPEVYNQALGAFQQIPIQTRTIHGAAYQTAYFPFTFGPYTLGVIGTYMPDDLPFATQIGRQLVALFAAVLTGTVVIVVFVGMSRVTGRMEKVTKVAESLAIGQGMARTTMQPGDEIGAMGQALDQYADYVQEKQDQLRTALRRYRREVSHLLSVIESMPEGVILQDLDGRVILMNDQARQLLGSQRVFRSAGIHELTAVVTDVLGPAIAPGLYALGDPQRIDLDDKMLSAQAAAVVSATENRLGTVVLLRDITDHVRQDQQREEMLGRLMKDIQQPLAGLAHMGARSQTDMVNVFAREITRHAVALQKMIVEMRDLSNTTESVVKRGQQPIRLETLIWAVANEWRQIAQAGNVALHVIIERKRLHILGDERRLRWAIGNVVDNAIKYTPPGGAMTLEIQEEANGMAWLRVRDNGVGISKEDLPQVFTRFYRGTPVTSTGRVIHVPGMGQGLNVSQQILTAHGGSIQIKSKQGVGTAVYLSIPLTSGETLELPYLDEADMDGETVLLNTGLDIDIE